MFSSRFSFLNHERIFVRVSPEATMLSQSRDGPLFDLFVTISTMSPFLSLYSSGTSLPLTFAPTQWWPTCVWMR